MPVGREGPELLILQGIPQTTFVMTLCCRAAEPSEPQPDVSVGRYLTPPACLEEGWLKEGHILPTGRTTVGLAGGIKYSANVISLQHGGRPSA